jgi:hypothetical protein
LIPQQSRDGNVGLCDQNFRIRCRESSEGEKHERDAAQPAVAGCLFQVAHPPMTLVRSSRLVVGVGFDFVI